MKQIDSKIIGFIEKYPFFTDPIVLFNPERIPNISEIETGKLDLKYPEIDKNIKIIETIKEDFFSLKELVQNNKFTDSFLKLEYLDRIEDFYNIIRIIECFYDKEEYEKYNLINDYYGINFKLLDEVFENKDILIGEFNSIEGKISKEKIRYIENTFIDSSEIKKYFREAIEHLGLEKNWKVKIGNVVSIVHTNFTQKGGDIVIPAGKNISLKKLITLIAHEIDGHCMQFSNASGLLSGSIRYAQSESLVEGYAMYIEYMMETYLTGTNNLNDLFNKNYLRFKLINNKIPLNKFLKKYEGNIFRNFRGFNNIDSCKNLKDFVYIQGLYEIISYKNKYGNFLELIHSGTVNNSFIDKYGIIKGRKCKFRLKQISAFYIFNKYFNG